MKIQGKDLPPPRTTEVEFAGAVVTIRALPLTFTDRLEQVLPRPVPPREFAKDRTGKLVRGDDGSPVVVYDERAPKYAAARSRHANLRGAAMIHEALKADSSVTWEAQEAAFKTPAEFYEAIYNELCGTSLTLGDLLKLASDINALSGLTPQEVAAARADFSATG